MSSRGRRPQQRWRSSLVALVLSFGAATCGPTPEPPGQLLERARLELQRGDLEAAEELALSLADRATHEAQPAELAAALGLHAEILVAQRRIPEALAQVEAFPWDYATPAVRTRATMTRGFARCFGSSGAETPGRSHSPAELDLREASRLAKSIGSHELEAEVLLRRGSCSLLRDDLAGAELHLGAALELARREDLTLLAAYAAGSLGNLQIRRGHFDDATRWLGHSLELAAGQPAEGLRAKTLGNLGWCYYLLGDDERAELALTRAEALARQLGYVGDRLIALTNLGRVREAREDYVGAEAHYADAAALAEQLQSRGESLALVAAVHTLRANLALSQGRWHEAARHLEDATQLQGPAQATSGDPASRLRLRLLEGRIAAGRGDLLQAESSFATVVGAAESPPELVWEARVAMARLHADSGRPAAAETELHHAFAAMEAALDGIRDPQHRIPFLSKLRRFHDDWVELLIARGEVGRALDIADHSRARLLREQLGLGAATGSTEPDFAALARDLDTVFLFYWTTPRRSFLWIVSRTGVRLATLPSAELLGSLVTSHQQRVLRSRDPLAEGAPEGITLWEILIAPATKELADHRRVVVVPDGPLHQLNFETLIVPDGAPHYWIHDVILATAPSLGLLRPHHEPDARAKALPMLLVMGDPLSASDEFPVLALAAREVEAVAGSFEPARRQVLTGEAAHPAAYLELDLQRFTHIHFAAHAQANRQIPLESAIVLSARGDRFKLYARDLLGVPLDAELVTLSACLGAGSRAFAAEGMVGLAWAFLSSGSAQVVAGLWNVEDASTALLMERFYREMASGLDPPAALREAKLALVGSDTAYRKPFYWAPFQVYAARLAADTRYP